mgnify:CR=1 FL=1
MQIKNKSGISNGVRNQNDLVGLSMASIDLFTPSKEVLSPT